MNWREFNLKNVRIPGFFRNFYVGTASLLFVWMLFFDTNDLFTQMRNLYKLRKIEQDRQYYLEKIAEVEQQRREIMGNDKLLEKYAREQYLMKKPTEDLYLVEDEADFRD